MLGYWNMKKETDDVIRNGWLHTGDIGEITKEGNLKINSKSATIEPTRNYEQFPLNVTSSSFDCLENTITIYFEEKINVRYLEFDNTKAGKNTNTIKTYRITAYS